MINIFHVFLFLSEIALWIGAGRLAFLLVNRPKNWSIVAFISVSLIFIVIWSFIFAPKADYRMPKLPRTIIIALLSIAFGLGLYLKGDLVFGLVILIGATLLQIVGQYFVAVD
ncbi:MAG: YrdB family protein [Chloroflexi bacterium]|nr:YrdB family protein [Chloroflexota bacterium]